MTEPYDPNPPATDYWPYFPPPSSYYATYPSPGPRPSVGPTDPYARPLAPARVDRPAAVVVTEVFGFTSGALLMVSGLVLFGGGSFVAWISAMAAGPAAIWLAVAGATNLISGGLTLVGATQLGSRRPHAPVYLTIAAGIVAVSAIAWMTQINGGTIAYLFLFTVPALIAAPLGWQPAVTQWLQPATT